MKPRPRSPRRPLLTEDELADPRQVEWARLHDKWGRRGLRWCDVCAWPVLALDRHPTCEPPEDVDTATARAVLTTLADVLGARPLEPR